MSGSLTNPWATEKKNPVEVGLQLSEMCGKKTTNTAEALSFLKSLPAKKLIEGAMKMNPDYVSFLLVIFNFSIFLKKARIANFITLVCSVQRCKSLSDSRNECIGESTLPWAIFRFRIFSNYFSQKFEKKKSMEIFV